MLRKLEPLKRIAKIWKGVTSFVANHPILSFYSFGAIGSAFGAHHYMKIRTESLESAVFTQVEMGTCPPLLNLESMMVPRKKTSRELIDLFFPRLSLEEDQEVRTFGLIVGPTGTGKTAVVTNLCNIYPKGVLYFEITEPKTFSTGLAKSLAMKIAPPNIFDLFLGYFSSDYFMYYRLSDDQEVALDSILEVLGRAAKMFKSVHGKMPTLFIDGADILAKHEGHTFTHLVGHAKRLANAGILKIVFVSSEGSILLVIQKLSGISRCSKIFEVTDVSNEAAVDYLIKYGVPRELSVELIGFFGGRFTYLISIVNLHTMYTKLYPTLTNEMLYEKIKHDIFSRKLTSQRWVINSIGKPSQDIIRAVSNEGEVIPSSLVSINNDPEKTNDINEAISALVDANILRYTDSGSLAWHGRPQQHEFEVR